ncbi:MAG: hypothetical protein AB2603_15055 [Candidatus Thiodiazotropha endolucinida]
MSGLLTSILNVIIVIGSILLAVYIGSNKNRIRNSILVISFGIALYFYEAKSLVSEGKCQNLEQTIIHFIIGLSDCIGIGDKPLWYAQIAILSGTMVLLFVPVSSYIEKAASNDKND